MKQIIKVQTENTNFVDIAMPLSENLSILMSEFNIDDKKLSDLSGVNVATIKKLRLGQTSNPTLDSLLPIAKYFDISVSQLIGEVSLDDTKYKDIPLLEWGDLESKQKESILIRSEIPADSQLAPDCFATQITIDKYETPFKINTVIVINPNKTPSDGDYVLCQFNNQLEICKLVTQLGQKFIASVVASAPQKIKLDALDNFFGTIIETRNILQPAISKDNKHILSIKSWLNVTSRKLILN